MTVSLHLLVVGSLGRCGGLLHENAPGIWVSVLCHESEVADLPSLADTDQVLALEPGVSWQQEVELVQTVQTRHPITHIAAFTADRYRHAADLARLWDVPVVPQLGDLPIPHVRSASAIRTLPRIATSGAVEVVVPVLAEHGDATVIALVGRHRTTVDGSDVTAAYLVSPGLLPPEASRSVVRHALAEVDGIGLHTGIATLTLLWDGARAVTLDVEIALPWTNVLNLVTAAVGIDLARCLARQAVGELVLVEVKRRLLEEADYAMCVWLVREPGGPTIAGDPLEVQGVDVAESHPSGVVTVDLLPVLDAVNPDPVRALVWARAGRPEQAREIAREAAGSLGFSTSRLRPRRS